MLFTALYTATTSSICNGGIESAHTNGIFSGRYDGSFCKRTATLLAMVAVFAIGRQCGKPQKMLQDSLILSREYLDPILAYFCNTAGSATIPSPVAAFNIQEKVMSEREVPFPPPMPSAYGSKRSQRKLLSPFVDGAGMENIFNISMNCRVDVGV